MRELLEFLARHGSGVVFVAVLVEQLGAPIPSAPVLLAAGALCGLGELDTRVTVFLALIACLMSDSVWYALGRVRGLRVLRTLCRISLEPDSCVSSSRLWFRRLGLWTLIVAKFVPGLSTIAPPMAGLTLMPVWRFLWSDAVGSLLWSGSFLALGFFFRRQLEAIADVALSMGSRLGVVLAVLLAAYIGYKYWQRRRFIKSLRIARIRPEDLHAMMNDGALVAIVDLRIREEAERDRMRIPGAIWIDRGEIAQHQSLIPRDRDVILYCT
jgi:membrane protein DedA with SNARE-associated domain